MDTESNRVVGLVGAVPTPSWLRSRTAAELLLELDRLSGLAVRFEKEHPHDVELADALADRVEALEVEVARRKDGSATRVSRVPALTAVTKPLLKVGGQ